MRNVGKHVLASICYLLTLLAIHSVQAQEVSKTDGRECEVHNNLLHGLASKTIKTKERLFVIARLGTGENNRYLNYRRLYNAREYFKLNIGKRLPEESLLFAEGEKVRGPGRVEFYLGSKLVMEVSFKRGGDFCVDCCEGLEKIYYGWGKTDRKKKE